MVGESSDAMGTNPLPSLGHQPIELIHEKTDFSSNGCIVSGLPTIHPRSRGQLRSLGGRDHFSVQVEQSPWLQLRELSAQSPSVRPSERIVERRAGEINQLRDTT